MENREDGMTPDEQEGADQIVDSMHFDEVFREMSDVHEKWAASLAIFRLSLELKGVSVGEAAVLTRDANWIYLCRLHFPEETPLPPGMCGHG